MLGPENASTVILLDLELVGSACAVGQVEVEGRLLLVALVPVNFVVPRIANWLPEDGNVPRRGLNEVNLCDR